MSTEDDSGTEDDNVVRLQFGQARSGAGAIPPDPEQHKRSVDKRKNFEELIAAGKVLVTLDARRQGVAVPPHLRDDPQLNLFFSTRFGRADFAWDDAGVRSTLSFGNDLYFCDVPWSAVWMMTSEVEGKTVVSPEDAPPELVAALQRALHSTDPADPASGESASLDVSTSPTPRSGGAHLRLVASPDDEAGSAS